MERAIRYKLEIDSRRLQQQNRDLKSILFINLIEILNDFKFRSIGDRFGSHFKKTDKR